MEGFLDPRSDLVFRRIFGEHPDILCDFLNAMLPLDSPIVSLEYLAIDQMPILPVYKRGIVDVRCVDGNGRQFIVEMQMQWTSAFLQRVLFNASQAYVKQLEKGETFELLQPVIALSLLDDTFIKDREEFYHHYRIVNAGIPERCIEGLEFVFVELPKLRESRPSEARRVRWAWLRFLRDAADAGKAGHPSVETFARETGINEAINEALRISRESNFSPAERDAYDRFWDAVRTERTLIEGKTKEALEQGLAKGEQIGREKGKAESKAEGKAEGLQIALKSMVAAGITEDNARQILGIASDSH